MNLSVLSLPHQVRLGYQHIISPKNWWSVKGSNLPCPQGTAGLQPAGTPLCHTLHFAHKTLKPPDFGGCGSNLGLSLVLPDERTAA